MKINATLLRATLGILVLGSIFVASSVNAITSCDNGLAGNTLPDGQIRGQVPTAGLTSVQTWTVTRDMSFRVTFESDNAGATNIFGYYVINPDGTIRGTPLFESWCNDPDPYPGTPHVSTCSYRNGSGPRRDFVYDERLPAGTTIGFALRSINMGQDVIYYSEDWRNADGFKHFLVYKNAANEYILSIMDIGNYGYGNMVVSLRPNSCGVAPSVITEQATDVLQNSVIMHGNLTNLGLNDYAEVWFEGGLGASGAYTTITPSQTVSATGVFSLAWPVLPDTTYHYRAAARNSSGTSYGQDMVVNTPSDQPPLATPTANAGTDQTVYELNTITLNSTSTGATSYSWSCNGGTLNNYSILQPIYTAPAVSQDTVFQCAFTATNSAGSNSDSVLINVLNSLQAPSVQTDAATNPTQTSIRLNGNLTGIGGYPSAGVYFEIGETIAYGQSTPTQTRTQTGAFNEQVEGLTAGRTYHFRAVAQNMGGFVYGQDRTFTTTAGQQPQNPSVNAGNDFTVASGGQAGVLASATGQNALSYLWTCTGGQMIPATAAQTTYHAPTVTATTTFTCTLRVTDQVTGLVGQDTVLITVTAPQQTPPTVQTLAANPVGQTTATLNGNLVSLGTYTSSSTRFQWGLTTSYGNATPEHSQTSLGAFSANLTNLTPNTTYHYRAIVQFGGTVYGSDMTFTTGQTAQAPTVSAGSDISVNSGAQVALAGSAVGQNPLTFNWSCPNAQVLNPTMVQATFVAPTVTANTTYACTLTATDIINGLSNTDSAVVTVVYTPPQVVLPTVATEYADATQTTATLYGRLLNLGGAQSASLWFEYGTTTNYGQTTTPPHTTNWAPWGYSSVISVLPGSTYHFRAVAQTNAGIAYGQDMTFTTGQTAQAPTVSAGPDISVNSGAQVALAGSAVGQNPLTFFWNCTGGQMNPSNSIQPTYNAPIVSQTTNYTCTLRATDNVNGLWAEDTVLVTVTAAQQTPPTVQTLAANPVGQTTATLNGNLVSLGTYTSSSTRFQWGLNTNYGNATPEQTRNSAGTFSANLTNLTPNTTYHYRAMAAFGDNSYGQDMTFTTGQTAVAPTVSAGPDVTVNSGAQVALAGSAVGQNPLTFNWSCPNAQVLNPTMVQATFVAPTVTANTTYACTLTATDIINGLSNTDSAVVTVVYTPPQVSQPQVQTNIATQVTQTSAFLNGNLISLGGASSAEVWFQIGQTTNYGYETNLVARTAVGAFSEQTVNLTPNTTYHYRAAARNSTGIAVYGQDQVFTTLPLEILQVQTNPATNIQQTSATLNGTLINMAGATSIDVWFEIGTTQNFGGATQHQRLSAPGQFSVNAQNLLPSTTYYYRAVANDSTVPAFGQVISFTTGQQANQPPVANAGPDLTVQSGGSTVLQGSGYSQMGNPITYSWSCASGSLFSTTMATPGYTAPVVSQNTPFACTLTVRDTVTNLFATDSMQINVLAATIQTQMQVQTNPATNIQPTQATLNGYAYGLTGNYATVWFQMGPNTNYGYETSRQTLNYAGQFNATVTGLLPNTAYHYRAVGQQYGGALVYGSDMTFTTNTGGGYQGNLATVNKMARNLSSGNMVWQKTINAQPGDVIQFQVAIQASGNQELHNIIFRDNLPSTLVYYDNLLIDNVQDGRNIVSGINLGNLAIGQTRTITYQVQVAPRTQFVFGTTPVTNNAFITSTETASSQVSSSATVNVIKSGVAGATTISTGLTNNIWFDSFLLPLALALAGVWLFRSKVFGVEEWIDRKKARTVGYHANKELQNRIARIRSREVQTII